MQRYFFTIFLFALAFCQARAQSNISIEDLKNLPGVKVVESITADQLVGELKWQIGSYVFDIIKLKGDGTFQLTSQDCLSNRLLETGTWNISFQRMLTLNFEKGKKLYDILKIDSNYYFVEPIQRRQFVEDFKDKIPLGLEYFCKQLSRN